MTTLDRLHGTFDGLLKERDLLRAEPKELCDDGDQARLLGALGMQELQEEGRGTQG